MTIFVYAHMIFLSVFLKNEPEETIKIYKSLKHITTIDPNEAEIIVIAGGDGTVLKTLRQLTKCARNPVIFAYNFGLIGLLLPFHKNQLKTHVKQLSIASESFVRSFKTLSRRTYSVRTKEENLGNFLNDIVLTGEKPGVLNSFELHINNNCCRKIRADSIIISTPTGSSAYNLSAGGPFVTNDCEVVIITVVSPFRSLFRTMVLPSNSTITITRKNSVCVIDGCERFNVDSIEVFNNGMTFNFAVPDNFEEQHHFERIFNIQNVQ